jgi:hypothetical protein
MGATAAYLPKKSKPTSSWCWGIVPMGGWYSDDKPLSAKEARKEQEKLDKEQAKRQRESASDKAKEDKDASNAPTCARFRSLNLTVQGTETIGGRPVWVIGAQPKPRLQAQAEAGRTAHQAARQDLGRPSGLSGESRS